MANGKTIGRSKPAPDYTRVEDGYLIHDTVSEALAKGEAIGDALSHAKGEKPTDTERGLRAQVVLLQRRVDQAEARASVLMNGGDRSNLSRPTGNAFDWMREFTERMVAMGDMTPAVRARKFDEMLADVKAHDERMKRHAADVEMDAAEWAARRRRGERPDE